jgi:glycosyltransferase involved in cell wall biosynthesis
MTTGASRRKVGVADRGIVMVTNAITPDQLGGLQRYVRELAGALVKRGIPVATVSKAPASEGPSERVEDDGVRVIRYSVPARSTATYAAVYPLASWRAVSKALRRLDGIPHVHYPLQGLPAAFGSARFVHTFHAPMHRELLPERQYSLTPMLRQCAVLAAKQSEALVARRAASTIVLTNYMKSELSLLAPRSAERAALIPSGVDTDFFCPGPPVDHPFATDASPLLFTARRLVPRTGVMELVRAMPGILEQRPNAKLAVAGDGPLRGALESEIAARSLGPSVVLLGRVDDLTLRAWYRAADLFVLPTQELEGFGISTVEALSCGTAAVGTPAGATPEVLGPLDAALVAGGVSAEDLVAVVTRTLANPTLLASVREHARQHVVTQMSWPVVAERHVDVYERHQHMLSASS